MSLQSYYDESYKSEQLKFLTSEFADQLKAEAKSLYQYVIESKNRFFPSKDWSDVSILEVGSGRGAASLLLSSLGAKVSLLDFSETALDQAKSLFQFEGVPVKTYLGDVTHPDLRLDEKFDLILDSHLLHCITMDPDRSSFYRFILDHLKTDGIFVSETMVHRKKIYIPDGFMFDEQNILWQMFAKWTPVRRILDSLDLEKELTNSGFKIIYFYYYGQYGFVPHKNFLDLPAEILPAAVRMVVQKDKL